MDQYNKNANHSKYYLHSTTFDDKRIKFWFNNYVLNYKKTLFLSNSLTANFDGTYKLRTKIL